jgi:glucose/mannose-6-phosphate isomerase
MYGEIGSLPRQLEKSKYLVKEFSTGAILPPKSILVAGMGGSAIGADLIAGWAEGLCSIPITVWRNYGLPAWANSKDTLVIASSHSGNTEETLSSFEEAHMRGTSLMAISTGGMLADLAAKYQAPWLGFHHTGQPRAAVGFSFGLLLGLLSKLRVIPDPIQDLEETISILDSGLKIISAEVPVKANACKRLAGQLMGRLVVVLSSDHLAVVARRWKGQLSEVAKAWAQFEYLPEADHNTAAGTQHPEEVLNRMIAIFLQSDSLHPRNQKRIEHTRQGFLMDGINTDIYTPSGKSLMAQLFSALQFGDFLSFYLAMVYDVDPTPIESIIRLKNAMQT